MSPPDISVVIPAHNRADLVGDAIDSVFAQVDCTVEVIVVDDGSTDETPQVLQGFAGKITTIRTEGIERGAARNKGARAANAPLIAFLDSDDYWAPTKMIRQLPLARDGHPSVTGVRFEDPSGKVLRTYVPADDAAERLVVENLFLAGPSSLVIPATSFFDVGGFPEELNVQGTEDWLLFLKLHRAGIKIRVVPEPLVHYRVHQTNFTSDPDRVAACMWAAADWLVERKMLSKAEERRLRGKTAVVVARQFARNGRSSDAGRWLKRAYREGSPGEALQGSVLVPLSRLKGLARRRPA